MANIGRPPCDEGVVRASQAVAPCTRAAAPWVLAATIIGSAMAFIDGTVVNVALPQIQQRLGATAIDAQWIVEAYALFLAALILVGGSLGDHYGRRRIFLLGVGIFTVASVACALALTPGQLIAARAVQGVGGALLVPGSLAIIGASFREENRGKAIGTWSGFSGITTAIGPVVGGYLVDNVSWRAAVILSLFLGALALVAFVARERRTQDPMLPLTLFRSRNFSGANLLTLLLYAALGGALYFLPFALIQVHGYSATAAGSSFLPFVIITFLLSRWAGGLVKRYGARLPLILGPVIAATGFILFALPGTEGSYWTTFFPAIVVLGFGMSFVIAPLTTTALNSVEGRYSGLASGVNNAISRSAGLLAIPILGIFVFLTFSAALDARTMALDLSPQARQQLEAEKADLGAAEVPNGVTGETAASVKRAVAESFVAGFRGGMVGAAVFALASAAASALIIEGKGSARRTELETAPAYAQARKGELWSDACTQ